LFGVRVLKFHALPKLGNGTTELILQTPIVIYDGALCRNEAFSVMCFDSSDSRLRADSQPDPGSSALVLISSSGCCAAIMGNQVDIVAFRRSQPRASDRRHRKLTLVSQLQQFDLAPIRDRPTSRYIAVGDVNNTSLCNRGE
jgi:hypothetical protein